MRLYTFCNYYLSSIQQGIQTAHVVADLAIRCKKRFVQETQFDDWANNHKTIIVLNGGNSASLIEIENLFNDNANPYPWVAFREDEQSLNSAITCVGIILPNRIYETAEEIRSGKVDPIDIYFDSYSFSIFDLVNSCQLAK